MAEPQPVDGSIRKTAPRLPETYSNLGLRPDLKLFFMEKVRIDDKTSNHTVSIADTGKILTNRGAGAAITFTLPRAATARNVSVIIYVVADQSVTVQAEQAGELIVFNDAAANSVAYSTLGEKVGGAFFCNCDGTSWLITPWNWSRQTVTITT